MGTEETIPDCTDKGCICRWSWSLTDDDLLIAFNCLQREVLKRTGINREAFTEQMEQVMDPKVNEFQAKIRDRFGVKEES